MKLAARRDGSHDRPDRVAGGIPALSRLHANIRDAFNAAGVQIMSPHFYSQPAQPVVVPEAHRNGVPPAD